jgi:hypothetical protein
MAFCKAEGGLPGHNTLMVPDRTIEDPRGAGGPCWCALTPPREGSGLSADAHSPSTKQLAGFSLSSADNTPGILYRAAPTGSLALPHAALLRFPWALPGGVPGRQVTHLLQVLLEDGQLLCGKRL